MLSTTLNFAAALADRTALWRSDDHRSEGRRRRNKSGLWLRISQPGSDSDHFRRTL